jgi:hypothetical protein
MDEMLAKILDAHIKHMREITERATANTQQAAQDLGKCVEAPWIYGDRLISDYLDTVEGKTREKKKGDGEDG